MSSSHDGFAARIADGLRDALVVGRYENAGNSPGARDAFEDANDHRLPVDKGEGFARKPFGGVARGDNGDYCVGQMRPPEPSADGSTGRVCGEAGERHGNKAAVQSVGTVVEGPGIQASGALIS